MARPKDFRKKIKIRTTITLIEGEDDDLIELFAGVQQGIQSLIKSAMRSGLANVIPDFESPEDANADLMAAMDDFFI